nr:immunoglobulin heavy chain junction region [Macaca mulatta]MOV43312.1 immunoglobulin heavy chain junction region [Macaca mulatta]
CVRDSYGSGLEFW